MYMGAALSGFGLIQACRSGLVLYSTVLSHARGENDVISAISERSLWCGKTKEAKKVGIVKQSMHN